MVRKDAIAAKGSLKVWVENIWLDIKQNKQTKKNQKKKNPNNNKQSNIKGEKVTRGRMFLL
jgi:dsDNA-specific endonuclease/ATPase MutS2